MFCSHMSWTGPSRHSAWGWCLPVLGSPQAVLSVLCEKTCLPRISRAEEPAVGGRQEAPRVLSDPDSTWKGTGCLTPLSASVSPFRGNRGF